MKNDSKVSNKWIAKITKTAGKLSKKQLAKLAKKKYLESFFFAKKESVRNQKRSLELENIKVGSLRSM